VNLKDYGGKKRERERERERDLLLLIILLSELFYNYYAFCSLLLWCQNHLRLIEVGGLWFCVNICWLMCVCICAYVYDVNTIYIIIYIKTIYIIIHIYIFIYIYLHIHTYIYAYTHICVSVYKLALYTIIYTRQGAESFARQDFDRAIRERNTNSPNTINYLPRRTSSPSALLPDFVVVYPAPLSLSRSLFQSLYPQPTRHPGSGFARVCEYRHTIDCIY